MLGWVPNFLALNLPSSVINDVTLDKIPNLCLTVHSCKLGITKGTVFKILGKTSVKKKKKTIKKFYLNMEIEALGGKRMPSHTAN